MAKSSKAKIKIENQAISNGDCRQAIHWYTNWLGEQLQAGHSCSRGLFATNFEEDDQLLLDTALSNLENKGIAPLIITGSDLYKQADYLWGLACQQAKYGQPAFSKFESQVRDCQFLILSNLDTPLSGQQLWYLYHYVLYPVAFMEKPILISTPLGYEEFVMYGAGCNDFEYLGHRITWEKIIALLNATVINLSLAKQLQQDNLPALLLPEYRFYKALQGRHLSASLQHDVKGTTLDFALIDEKARQKLNIECDFIHRLSTINNVSSNLYARQKERDTKLIKEGWQVLRFSFKEIAGSLDSCIDAVEELCRNNNKKSSVGRCISLPMLSAKINLPVPDSDELEAIAHPGGPAAIVGGAGSGKTTCIAERVAFLLGQGASPERILVLSQSVETVRSIKQAAEKIMPGQLLDKVNFYAWHELGMRILKENVSAIKRKLPLKLENSSLKILQKLIAKHKKEVDPTKLELHGDLDEQTALSMISGYKANLITPQMIKDRGGNEAEQLLAKVYLSYEEQMQKANKIDSDDMVSLAAQLLGQDTDLRSRYENLFEHIIADEYQDVTPACDFLARVLACPNDNIIIVGNDDESLYEMRGANTRLLSETSIRLPNASCYLLKHNWRSHPQITKHIEQFVTHTVVGVGEKERIEKSTVTGWGEVPTESIVGPYEFYDERKQNDWIMENIQELLAQGRRPEEISIICRSKEQLTVFEQLLAPYGLVVNTDNPDVNLLPDEATDVLTFLRLVADPDGPKAKEQFERVCQLRSRTIDSKLSATIASFAETNNLSYLKALEIYSEIAADPFCTQLEQLVKRIRDMHQQKLSPAEIINLLKKPQWLGDYYKSIKLPPRVVYEPLRVMTQMQDQARGIKTVVEFIKNYSPASGVQQTNEEAPASLTLLTIEEAKGREFKVVFLPYLVDGILPDKNQSNVKQEERMFYVAATRAREILYLSTVKKIDNRSRQPSPFLRQANLQVLSYGKGDDEIETKTLEEVAESNKEVKGPDVAEFAIGQSEASPVDKPGVPPRKSEAPPAKTTNIFALLDQSTSSETVEEKMPAEEVKKTTDLSEAVSKVREARARKSKCINCHAALEAGTRFCGECGAVQQVPQQRKCKACGEILGDSEKFCGQCGSACQ